MKYKILPGTCLVIGLCSGIAGHAQHVQKFSHRGGRGLMPENTIIAMKNALDFRTNLEMDLYLSKDNQVFVCHSSSISPVYSSNPDGSPVTKEESLKSKVFDLDYSTIRKFDVGSRPDPEFPRRKNIKAYIPLFAELIDSVACYVQRGGLDKPQYSVEIKVPNGNLPEQYRQRLVDAAMQIISEKHIAERTIIQSFDVAALEYLHKKYPAAKTAYLVLARDADYISALKKLSFKPTAYSPPYKIVTPQLIDYCHKNNMQVVTWTVDTKEDIERLKQMGVDAIISDYPDFFLEPSTVSAIGGTVAATHAGGVAAFSAADRFAANNQLNAALLAADNSFNVADYATAAQLAGTADATSAWQAAVDAAAAVGGGVIYSPSDAQWWFSGSAMVMLSNTSGAPVHDITFDGRGCKLFKNSNAGNYVIFLDRYGAMGYGGGANRLLFKNFNVYGSFANGAEASVNLFTGNHSRDITFQNCTFNQANLQGSHTFELDGCDNVLIQDCTWYGYKWDSTSAPRSEAINTDNSVVGAGAAVAGYADGLPCRNITVNRCRFYPWTNPVTGSKYPASAPLGTHGSDEYGRPENITAADILVVDPANDNTSSSASVDNPYIRGLIHYPAVKGLYVRNMHVVATDNLGSIRCVTAQSSSTGVLASSDPNNPVSGTYTTPLLAEDIDIDLTVSGMLGGTVETNNMVQVVGVSGGAGSARNVRIRVAANGIYRNAVYLRYVDDASVDVNVKNADAVRFTSCNRVQLSGIMSQVRVPLVANACSQITVGPLSAINTSTQSSLLAIQNGTDRIVATGINAVGYTNLYSSAPANRAQAAVLGPAVP